MSTATLTEVDSRLHALIVAITFLALVFYFCIILRLDKKSVFWSWIALMAYILVTVTLIIIIVLIEQVSLALKIPALTVVVVLAKPGVTDLFHNARAWRKQ
jgi:hypothetical protein